MREQGRERERERDTEPGGGEGEERFPARQQPFRGLSTSTTRLGQLLDEFFGPSPLGAAMGGARSAWPAVDVEEDDQAYYVCVEAPGIQREDLDVEIDHDMITVRGERRRNESGPRSRWSERSYGRFVRSFSLPPDASPEQARAEFRDGMLTLTFPKHEQARPRRIEIQGQGAKDTQGGGKQERGRGRDEREQPHDAAT
jgi:HSP20 family protein